MLTKSLRNMQRILAVSTGNVGETIMVGPALRTLRQAVSGAKITLMASPHSSAIMPLLPWVDHDLPCHLASPDRLRATPAGLGAEDWQIVTQIRSARYDAAFIFTSSAQSPYSMAHVFHLAGVPIRVGQSSDFRGEALTHCVRPAAKAAHQVDRHLSLLESVGIPVARKELEMRTPPHVQARADDLLESAGISHGGATFILLAPGSSRPARFYDPVRYGDVVRALYAETGLPTVIVGHEREIKLAEMVISAAADARVVSLVGKTSVLELGGIIRRARLVIGNHSAPMYMADALQRSMVVMFSGTHPERERRPRFAHAKVLRRPTKCTPCYLTRCPSEMECLDIPPAEVVKQCLDLLQHPTTETGDDAGSPPGGQRKRASTAGARPKVG